MHGNAEDRAAWTVLVYMAGDNNLTEEMAWGLQELKKTAAELSRRTGGQPGERINVVAHFDPRGSRSRRYDFAPPNPINQPVPAAAGDGNLDRFVATIDTRRPELAQTLAPRPQALPAAADVANPLARFVAEQVGSLSLAKHYFLILSGHGSGAVGDFLIDSNPKTSLSIPGLALLLKSAREAYARRLGATGEGKRIAILGMDSCLMSNAEVCFEVREHADYIVGSEGWVANAGWPYHRVLESCLEDAKRVDANPGSVARRVADSYAAFYRDYEISGLSTDIGVCSLNAFRDGSDGAVISRLASVSRVATGSFDAAYVQRTRTMLGHGLVGPGGEAGLPVVAAEKQLIDDLLGCLTALEDADGKRLRATLEAGSAAALAELCRGVPLEDEAGTQRRALVEFLDSVRLGLGLPDTKPPEHAAPAAQMLRALARYDGLSGEARARGQGADLRAEMATTWGRLTELLAEPPSASIALAVVRLRREWDPGVLEALRRLERQDRLGAGAEDRPRAKQGRAILQKLHQVRSIVELHGLAGTVPVVARDEDLLNAVVAARWRAQSFKGGVYVDLYDFCDCLAGLAHPAAEALALVRRTSADVVLRVCQTGPATQHAKGLSVYFPSQTTDYSPEYENLEFAKATGWGRLVRSYLRATRRERRDEVARWAEAGTHLRRFGHSEVDPLEADGIEARIVGVIAPPLVDGDPAAVANEEALAKEAQATLERIGAACVAQTIDSLGAEIAGEIETALATGLDAWLQALPEARSDGGLWQRIKAGLEQKIRAGLEQRIRAGLEQRIKAGLEQRIKAGLEQRIRAGLEQRIRAGLEQRIRAGLEQRIKAGLEQRIKAGLEQKIRAGTEAKIRSGTEAKIRGEGALFEWGNPPDGFFHPPEHGGNGRPHEDARA